MKRRCPPRPNLDQPPSDPEGSLKRSTQTQSATQSTQNRNSRSDQKIVEGQFDDASSSPEKGHQFDDASEEEEHYTSTQLRPLTLPPVIEYPTQDDEDLAVRLNLVSSEESPPKQSPNKDSPSDKLGQPGLNLTRAVAAASSVATYEIHRSSNLTSVQDPSCRKVSSSYQIASQQESTTTLDSKLPALPLPETSLLHSTNYSTPNRASACAAAATAAAAAAGDTGSEKFSPFSDFSTIPLESPSSRTTEEPLPPLNVPIESCPSLPSATATIASALTSTSPPKAAAAAANQPISPSAITANDVLLGRGGGTNRHNAHFRQFVSEAQPRYVQARKRDKTKIAKSIVATIRALNGRFLKLNNEGRYVDVGDKQATSKTSQALREGLSGRMREIVQIGGVGVSQLKRAGITEETVGADEEVLQIDKEAIQSQLEEDESPSKRRKK
mmetsp:Transcript_31161/g.35835  ORF Transcript_31161/g.35835 Transcript_31161/m.35835 type:complete len:442 (-) Transcript_31161:162-1487(-)